MGGQPGGVGWGGVAPGVVDAEGGDDQAVGGEVVLVGDLGGDGGGGGADDRAPLEGAGNEGAVAGRGVGHHLGVAQVGEVVDGDDDRGPAGRGGGEVGGVEDLDRAGEPLDRGPGQAGPGGLEEAGRDPAVAVADPGAPGGGGGQVAGATPAEGDQDELLRLRAGQAGQGPGQPCHVPPDARPRPEQRGCVEPDPHRSTSQRSRRSRSTAARAAMRRRRTSMTGRRRR